MKNNNYVIIGDSITYGIGDFKEGGWVGMFKNYVVNQDDSKDCSNYVHIAGFPGAKSDDILNRIDDILQAFKHSEFFNTAILSIGVNDAQEYNGAQKSSREQYKKNITNIIKRITEADYRLIILGLTRIESDEKFFWKPPNKYYDNSVISEYDKDLESTLKYDAELKVLCKNNKIQYIPLWDVLQKEDFVDGLHPNTNGHKKIFEKVLHSLLAN